MTRRALVLLLALVLLTVVPVPGPGRADASCAAPVLDRPVGKRPALARGEATDVSGSGFRTGCADSVACPAEPGCGACVENDEEVPQDDVRLQLRQKGRSWDLGVADADESTRVSWRVVVPGGARPGPARLLADGAEPLLVRLT